MKKLLPYILILIILAGFFGFGGKASAQTAPGCYTYNAQAGWMANGKTKEECVSPYKWIDEAGTVTDTSSTDTSSAEKKITNSLFEEEIAKNKCSLNPLSSGTFWPGCFIQTAYALFYVIPSLFLWVSSYFFNVLISSTLYSKLFYDSTFLPEAWGIVRDLSNIFFILILLYIAIQIILDLGGHEAKKMIVKVIIIALLINFSMFFTKIVIDSSNILALIFYNKLEEPNTKTRPYTPISKAKTDKDAAGAMVGAFDPTKLMTEGFFKKAKTSEFSKTYQGEDINTAFLKVAAMGTLVNIASDGKDIKMEDLREITPGVFETPGKELRLEKISETEVRATFRLQSKTVSPGILIGITLLTGIIMFFAAYAFVIAGLSFLGRLIELFILIIFSPFAFMSFTVPKLAGMEYIGWDDWLKRLIKVSFMAPIFMFFLYFIFLLTGTPGFFGGFISQDNPGFIESILLMVIPAVMILILLLKATDFAKKGSGKLGEMVMKGAKIASGVALGAATGGAALLGTGMIGGIASRVAGSDKLKQAAIEGKFGARLALKAANYGAGASFDVRQTGFGKYAAKKTGMDLSKGLGVMGLDTKSFEGGRKKQIEHKAEEEEKRMKTYELSKSASIKQDARNAQYKKDWEEAKRLDPDLKESRFRKVYEEGGNLEEFGIEGPREAGKVSTAKEVNMERRDAYANSLAAKNAVNSFFTEWAKGSAKMLAHPVGLGTTAAIGVATGGIGTAVAIVGGGFLQAFKKQVLGVTSKNAEVVAATRKGEDALKKIIADLKKVTGHEEKAGTPHEAPQTPPSSTPPVGGSHSTPPTAHHPSH